MSIMTEEKPLTTTQPLVAVNDLDVQFSSKRGQVTALQGIDLDVAPGEFISIAGPSGCGKSTLLKVIAGLTGATSGSVKLRNEPVAGARRDVGDICTRADRCEWRSVRGSTLLRAGMRGRDKSKAAKRADNRIEMAGLKAFEKSLPHELSGAMQQRVSLCRSLLHEPDVLLMD